MLTAYLMLITVLGAIDTESAAQPVVVPKSIIAQVGTVVRFNCTAIYDDPVYWTTKPYGSKSTNDIYIGEKLLVEDYGRSGRFSVAVNRTTRRHDLIINDTKQTDGGVYSCIDERGLGKKAYAELVVLDKVICQEEQRQDSYMGDNVFGLDQDVIRFTCRMNYTGNIRPQLEWSASGKKLRGTQGTESGIASSSLILVATSKLNGVNVTCEAVIQGISAEEARTGVLWTSDTIRVKYAVLKKQVIKECPGIEETLDCNPPCSYKLETINGTQSCAINYSARTDYKWSHFYGYIGYNSEPGCSIRLSGVTVFFIISCSLAFFLVMLFIGYLVKRKCFKKKEAIPLLENTSQPTPVQDAEANQQENTNGEAIPLNKTTLRPTPVQDVEDNQRENTNGEAIPLNKTTSQPTPVQEVEDSQRENTNGEAIPLNKTTSQPTSNKTRRTLNKIRKI